MSQAFQLRARQAALALAISLAAQAWLSPTPAAAQAPAQQPPAAPNAQGGAGVSGLEPAQLDAAANMRIMGGHYADAIPYLRELVGRFGSSTDPDIQQRLAALYRAYGFCLVMAGQHEEGIAVLDMYISRFPKGLHIQEVVHLKGDSYRLLEQWEKAAETYDALLKNYQVPRDIAASVLTKLGEVLIEAGKHADAKAPLDAVLERSLDPDFRSRALTGLLKCYIALNELDAVYSLVPRLHARDSAALYSLEFNITAIDGGDQLLASQKYAPALLLFKLAKSKKEILAGLTRWNAELVANRTRLMAAGSGYQHILAVNEQLGRIARDLEQLNKVESYSEQLRLRVARTFFELGLKWEALWAYRGVYDDFPKSEQAVSSLFAACTISYDLALDDRAVELGKKYMADYPTSDFYEQVALTVGRSLTRQQKYAEAVQAMEEALAAKPDFALKDQALFIQGYSLLFLDKNAEALAIFDGIKKNFAQGPMVESASYWGAYGHLLEPSYEKAAESFREFVGKFPQGPFTDDAQFRFGVSLYGSDQPAPAREQLKSFIAAHPAHALRPEAHSILGDIAGSLGELDEAIAQYSLVETLSTSMDQINYAAFQIGKAREARGEWDEAVRHFREYIERYGDKGNYTEGVYRLSLALKQQDKLAEAVNMATDAVRRFGNDPKAAGVDSLLKDLPADYQALKGSEAPLFFKTEIARARDLTKRTLEMRLQMALAQVEASSAGGLSFTKNDIAVASPATAVWIGQLMRKKEPELAQLAFERVIAEFPESDECGEAFMQLAEMAAAAGDIEKAVGYLEQIKRRFPTYESAARALVMQGDLLRKLERYAEAAERYDTVLQVKEWRGPLYPECLYKIGLCRMQMGEYREAFAFFQRVYVLYQHFETWTARAYLQSGICLEKLGETPQALATYDEMMKLDALASTKEYEVAADRRKKIVATAK